MTKTLKIHNSLHQKINELFPKNRQIIFSEDSLHIMFNPGNNIDFDSKEFQNILKISKSLGYKLNLKGFSFKKI